MKKCVLLLMLLMLLISACGPRIPSKLEIIEREDPFPQDMAGIEEKKLIKVWGEPFYDRGIALYDQGPEKVWLIEHEKETRFITVRFEDEKILTVNTSFPMNAVIMENDGTSMYLSMTGPDHTIDMGTLTTCPSIDYFGEDMKLEPGMKVRFQYSGLVMESYPAQIGPVYSVEILSMPTEEEMQNVRELMVEFRENMGM